MTDFPRLKAKYADLVSNQMQFECGPGWEQILDRYFQEVSEALPSGTHLRVERIYEKNGSLRIDAMPEEAVAASVRLALSKAEILADSRSYRYCETCGQPGSLRDKHRLFVACETHADGASPLPPDEGGIELNGIAYEYDPDFDDLVVVDRIAVVA